MVVEVVVDVVVVAVEVVVDVEVGKAEIVDEDNNDDEDDEVVMVANEVAMLVMVAGPGKSFERSGMWMV